MGISSIIILPLIVLFIIIYGFIKKVDIYDEFLNGGYGKTSLEEIYTIKECIANEGLIIDPTYTGKAFWGMTSILKRSNCKNKRVLFWNTGGLINLLSQKDEFIGNNT